MPRDKPSQDTKLIFGKQMADHMLVAEWTLQNGWDIPSIVPFGPLAIPPSASVLHYGIEVCYFFISYLLLCVYLVIYVHLERLSITTLY